MTTYSMNCGSHYTVPKCPDFNCTGLSPQLTIMTEFHARLKHGKYLPRMCCLLFSHDD